MEKKTGLDLLRVPFSANQISKLPKGTKAQNECLASEKINCKECGGWHHPRIIHLDYVGHAALTDRLLDVDPNWSWEPMSLAADGTPFVDRDGGMWIKLTVLGVTRLGYGDAQGKTGGNATKERIGDALRNAAMRFGCALDLWHKGDLHAEEEAQEPARKPLVEPDDEYKKLCADNAKSIETIKYGIATGDLSVASEAWQELSNEIKGALWRAPSKGGIFTTAEREIMKSSEFREAHFGV